MLGLGLIHLRSRQHFSNLDVWLVWKLEGMGGGGERVLEITKERPLRKSSLGIHSSLEQFLGWQTTTTCYPQESATLHLSTMFQNPKNVFGNPID